MGTTSKETLRKRFLAARKAFSAREAERISVRVVRNIVSLPRLLEADLVTVYHRIGAEVDTRWLIDILMASGRGVALPYTRGDGTMGIGRIWTVSDDLTAGPRGVMEPVDRLKDNVRPDQPGAVVCPGVAFDAAMTRLGRGGGHYDRFLRELKGRAYIVGCAFDCQISGVPLPAEEHDIPMDAVVTESRAFPEGCCPAVTSADEADASKEEYPAI